MEVVSMLENKVALITGGASGIGAATVRLFQEEGARVIVADRDVDAGEQLADELGDKVDFHACDVADEHQVAKMLQHVMSVHGRLDCAVNNAGVLGEAISIERMSLATWQRVLDVNLSGVFLCLKYELEVMQAARSGAIVNVASGAGLIGVPNMAAYCASKHGVLGLTKTAAMENVRCGIRINAVLPGSIETPMLNRTLSLGGDVEQLIKSSIPCGRFGRAEEVAQSIAWLCSDRASYVSGEALSVDYATICR